jgi:hypothetical protein
MGKRLHPIGQRFRPRRQGVCVVAMVHHQLSIADIQSLVRKFCRITPRFYRISLCVDTYDPKGARCSPCCAVIARRGNPCSNSVGRMRESAPGIAVRQEAEGAWRYSDVWRLIPAPCRLMGLLIWARG